MYQADVTGVDCSDLVEALEMAIDSSPSLLVLGNLLELRADCDVGVTSEDFVCTMRRGEPGENSGGINLIMIAGAAVGGALLVALVLIFCMVLVVCRKKKRRTQRSRM